MTGKKDTDAYEELRLALEARMADLDRWQKSLNRQQKQSVQNVARLERAMTKQLERSRLLLDDVDTLRAEVQKALRRDRG